MARKPTPQSKLPQNRPSVSRKMRDVIEIMVNEGIPLTHAAERGGMHVNAARRAFRQSHVKALFNQRIADLKENAAQLAYLGILDQTVNAESERLRYDARRWVAGVDGISPVQKVAGQHQHTHQFGGFEYERPDAKDITPDILDVVSEGDE